MHLRAVREAQGAGVLEGPGAGTLLSTAPPTVVDPSAATVTASMAPATTAVISSAASVAAAGAEAASAAAAAAAAAGGGGTSSSGNSSSVNVTDHFLDDETEDNSYSEMQTVALACIATLIPLFIILVAAFAIRFLWRKFRPRPGEGDGEAAGGPSGAGYDGVLQRDESAEGAKADAVGGASGNGSGAHLLLLMPDELKTSESQFSVTPGEMDDVTSQSPLIGGSVSGKGHSTVSNHKGVGTSKSANGSVITMTLQNNHLIVETEELASLPMVDEGEPSPPHAVASSVEDTAQVHQPPPGAEFRRAAPEDDLLDDDDELVGDLEGIAEEDEDEVAAAEREEEAAARGRREPTGAASLAAVDSDDDVAGTSAKAEEDGGQAGLSQSDLSESSSIGSSNPTYRYGNQLGYASGHFGYPQYAGYEPPKVQAPAEEYNRATEEEASGHWPGGGVEGSDPMNCVEAGAEEDEEEKRHQLVQEQLGGGSGAEGGGGRDPPGAGGGHHRTGSLPKAAADDSVAVLGGAGVDAERIRGSKRRSLPIITHTPSAALGGFKKLLNEEDGEEGGGGAKKKQQQHEVLKELPDGELEVAEGEAPGSRGGSDGAAPASGGAGTNSGEHENEAFVETD